MLQVEKKLLTGPSNISLLVAATPIKKLESPRQSQPSPVFKDNLHDMPGFEFGIQ